HVDRLVPEIAGDIGASRSPRGVHRDVVLEVARSTGLAEDREAGQAPSADQLEEAAAIVTGMVQLPPHERGDRLHRLPPASPAIAVPRSGRATRGGLRPRHPEGGTGCSNNYHGARRRTPQVGGLRAGPARLTARATPRGVSGGRRRP